MRICKVQNWLKSDKKK